MQAYKRTEIEITTKSTLIEDTKVNINPIMRQKDKE